MYFVFFHYSEGWINVDRNLYLSTRLIVYSVRLLENIQNTTLKLKKDKDLDSKLGFLEILLDSVRFFRLLWDSLAYFEILYNPLSSYTILSYSLRIPLLYHMILKGSEGY